MSICAVMQPTYLPWIGYFDLIDQADIFVFLDNVQFSKQTWQQRNKIKTPSGLEWLNVPVFIKGRFGQKINEVEIKQEKFPDNHIKTIKQNYQRSPFYKDYAPELYEILSGFAKENSLCNLNIQLIKWLCRQFAIQSRFYFSSELAGGGNRSACLVNICCCLGSKSYLSTTGAAAYLEADLNMFTEREIEVFLHAYEHPQYAQLYPPFLPYACSLDLLFNQGEMSREVIRSGRKPVEKFLLAYSGKSDDE